MKLQGSIQEEIHSLAPLLTDFFHTVKEFLTFVKDFPQVHREQFGEKEVREYYGQVVSSSTEKIGLTLTQFLHFIKVSLPIRKTDTVHTLIEDLLKRHAGKIEEKQIHLSKNFEDSLPETMVPKAQLFFILDSLIECMIAVMSSEGKLWISTKTVTLETENAVRPPGSRKYIEMILISLSKERQHISPPPGVAVHAKVQALNLILPFIKDMVRRNRGVMKCKLDEEKDTVSVKMRFPIERRHLACYELPETAERETREAKSVPPSHREVVKKMAGGLAHELNNTLTPVIGNADLLLSEMRNQEPAHRLVQATMEAGERGSSTLLVVESEAELLGRIHSSFAELGYAVIPVESSEQAFSEISNHAGSIDLLVTDVVLPGKSGVDLAKSLWTKYPRMKTIFLTSCPEDWKSIFKDAVQVVTKPVDLRILLEKVRQALRERAII